MINVTILSPLHKEQISVEWLDLMTIDGSMVIMPGHASATLILAKNQEVTLGMAQGTTKAFSVAGGLCSIHQNNATIIVEPA